MIVCNHPPVKFTIGDKTYISPVLGVGWLEVAPDFELEEFQPAAPPFLEYDDFLIYSTGGGKKYRVRRYLSGETTCTCEGFMYRKKCKHVRMPPWELSLRAALP